MSTDRELLELAARAAGIEYHIDHLDGTPKLVANNYGAVWNPLYSDAQALGLAVKLKIDISFFEGYQQVLASTYCCEHEAFIDYTDDRAKDVRLAIVTVAASVGESMP